MLVIFGGCVSTHKIGEMYDSSQRNIRGADAIAALRQKPAMMAEGIVVSTTTLGSHRPDRLP